MLAKERFWTIRFLLAAVVVAGWAAVTGREILAGGGSRFDPRVTQAFEACLPALEGLDHELRA